MAVSFIHTADWQIGKQFGLINADIAAHLRKARFDAIKKIAELGNLHQVDAILVAGDVFDANEVSDTTLRITLNAMQEYQGAWVLLPGNHDPALTQSVWSRIAMLQEKSSNIILATEAKPILLANSQLIILPAPLKQRHEFKDLTDWFDGYEVSDSAFKVGLAHGSIAGWLPESAEVHNIISYQRVETAGLDYLALGDWHGQLKVSPRIWYAGTPEQDRFNDNNPGNVLLVKLTDKTNIPSVESIATGIYQWHCIERNLFQEKDIEELGKELAKFEPDEYQIIHLNITGNLSLEDRQQLTELLKQWEARFAMLEINDHELKLTPSEEDLQAFSSMGFLGKTLERLLAIRDTKENENQPYAERAIQLLWQQLQLSREGR